MHKVNKPLQKQLDLNERKNLLHAGVAQLLEVEPTFLAALEELLSSPTDAMPANTLEAVCAKAADSFIAKIHSLNQYIQIDRYAKDRLKAIYKESWQKLVETKEVESTLRTHHYPRIKSFIESLYPNSLAGQLQSAPQLGRVCRSQYSADLQTRLLRLDLGKLRTPILDIGCGQDANLVHFLRSKDLEAYGIDRSVKVPTDFLSMTDWFEYEYGRNKWGTIVSNLAISNHLKYAQVYDAGRIPAYLKTFQDIINSLALDGTLTIAPAVDLMKKLADRRSYATEEWEMSSVAKVLRITRIAL